MEPFLYLETVDSTNRYAADHFDELADGTLIQAGMQTGGRGRLGRRWASPVGNAYVSYVMKDVTHGAFHATMIASLAVLKAVNAAAPQVDAWIKWPNDVFVRDCKLCGILCESVIRNGQVAGIICGIGVNVNMTPEALSSVGQPAVSLFSETKNEINLNFFVKQLAIFLKWYYIIEICSEENLFDQWKKENRLIGKTTDFIGADGETFSAEVLDIAPDGQLVIRRSKDFPPEHFTCGDVKAVLKH